MIIIIVNNRGKTKRMSDVKIPERKNHDNSWIENKIFWFSIVDGLGKV